jgi:hypothetical protein
LLIGQQTDGPAAPVPVDAEAEDAIEQVVPGRDGVEHVLNGLGLPFNFADGGMAAHLTACFVVRTAYLR